VSREAPHAGLGTSIVEALAHQLKATVEKTSGAQGTTVTIIAPALGLAYLTSQAGGMA
jgi:two-component sensor histidine kinase